MRYDIDVQHLVAIYWDGPGHKEPFICGVNGKFTIESLEEIQTQIRADIEEYTTKGAGTYTFSATYFQSEYEGVYRTEPAYWDLQLVEFENPIRPNTWALYGMKTPVLANIIDAGS